MLVGYLQLTMLILIRIILMWNLPLQGVVAQVVVAGVQVVLRAPVVLHNINQKEVVLSRLEFKEIISSSSVMWFDPDKTWIEV